MLWRMPRKQTLLASFLTALVASIFSSSWGLLYLFIKLQRALTLTKLNLSDLMTINRKWQSDNLAMQRDVCMHLHTEKQLSQVKGCISLVLIHYILYKTFIQVLICVMEINVSTTWNIILCKCNGLLQTTTFTALEIC